MNKQQEAIYEMREAAEEMSQLWDQFKNAARVAGVSEYDRRTVMAGMDIAFGVGGWATRDKSLFEMLDSMDTEAKHTCRYCHEQYTKSDADNAGMNMDECIEYERCPNCW